MKLPAGATKGLPETPPRGRMYAVTRLSSPVAQRFAVAVLGTLRHSALAGAVREAEAIDCRLNPTIVLVEKED